MLTITPADRIFIIDMLNRRGHFYNARPSARGTRSPIVDVRLGATKAAKLGALLDATPRPTGKRQRIRIRGTAAQELLAELMPDLDTETRRRAREVMARA